MPTSLREQFDLAYMGETAMIGQSIAETPVCSGIVSGVAKLTDGQLAPSRSEKRS